MNNYVSTEKSLKRWLKNRVKVTMATVVGFLIAGTVTFAATASGIGAEGETKTGITEITSELFGDNVGVYTSTDKEGIPHYSAIDIAVGETAHQVKATGNLQSKNEKSWLMTVQDGIELTIDKNAVLNGENLDRVTLNLYGETTTVNNGTIEKAEKGWGAITINGGTGGKKAEFTNNGTILGAVNIEKNVDFTNSGTIEGAIYADSNTGIKNIILEGNSKIDGISLKGDNNTLTINDVEDTIELIEGISKITVTDSNITFADGEINRAITADNKFLLNIKNSDVTNKMDLISEVGESATIGTSALINNYGTDAGTYTLINEGILSSNNAANGVYSNAAEGVTLNVTNKGNVEISGSKWATGLNGKFDAEVKNAVISMTNEGQITVTNGAGMDITNAGDANNKGTLVNTDKGTITTSSFSVGMLATGTGVEAINRGTIVINDAEKHADGRLSYGMQAKKGAVVTNEGTIILEYADIDNVKAMGTADETDQTKASGTNTGKVKLSDISSLEDFKDIKIADGVSEEYLAKLLFNGNIEHNGMIVNKLGVNLFADANVGNENDLTGSTVEVGQIGDKEGTLDKVTVGTAGTTIKGSNSEEENTINTEVFNASGEVNIAGGQGTSVVIEADSTNLDVNGKFAVADNTTLGFAGGTVNAEKTDADGNEIAAVTLEKNSTLKLDGTTFSGNIGTETQGTVEAVNAVINGNITAAALTVTGAEEETAVTYIDGEIAVTNITVGTTTTRTFANAPALPNDAKDTLVLSSSSEFTAAGTLTIEETGKVVLEVGTGTDEYGVYNENAFANSEVKISVDGTGELQLSTDNVSGETVKVDIGNTVIGTNLELTTNSDIYKVVSTIDKAGQIVIEYDKELYKDNATLNEINNAAVVLNGGTFSGNKAERAAQLDKIYSENIYSETVRAAYDSLKMSEEAVLSLAHEVKAGEFKADGKALYSKDEYTKDGSIGSYDAEVESTGLLASFEYGLSDTATAGVVFSGVKQDVDTDGGSADADLFYLGVFGTKAVGNYDFTAGLGYQFGEYEADNNIANIAGSDKYDSTAFSGYVQGRYTADLGDGLSIQPKVKLGYTYLKQDDAKDSYFGVSDAEISTFDAELGLDVVKSVQFEKSRLDVKFGASYVRTMGDTDEMFKGHFYGNGTSSFDVIGAELAENVVKFNLGAESVQENGFFYNGGFTYEFGSNDTEAYGVNLGVGYKF